MDDSIFQIHSRLLNATSNERYRYLYKDIDWSNRLICLTGARGTGKTTLLLQHIKIAFKNKQQALYISLDNLWFTKNSLFSLADKFYALGGTHLFIDEVHRYPNWSMEIKNIYDSYPSIHIVFTGSSILEIYKANADLSRRAVSYHLYGLSFREFINFETSSSFEPISLEEITQNHVDIVSEINSKIQILPIFIKYLEYGYYPFYKEGINSYAGRLLNVVNAILDNDLPSIESVEYTTIRKIKRMLSIITTLVPFTPNMTSLSANIETNRATALKFLNYLEKAKLIRTLNPFGKAINLMNKPDKIYLDNSNLIYAISGSNNIDKGNLRETFFANQCSVRHSIYCCKQGDFYLDNDMTFEVGGRNKNYSQIKNISNSFIAMDGLEIGYGNKIPLWLFGFTY